MDRDDPAPDLGRRAELRDRRERRQRAEIERADHQDRERRDREGRRDRVRRERGRQGTAIIVSSTRRTPHRSARPPSINAIATAPMPCAVTRTAVPPVPACRALLAAIAGTSAMNGAARNVFTHIALTLMRESRFAAHEPEPVLDRAPDLHVARARGRPDGQRQRQQHGDDCEEADRVDRFGRGVPVRRADDDAGEHRADDPPEVVLRGTERDRAREVLDRARGREGSTGTRGSRARRRCRCRTRSG